MVIKTGIIGLSEGNGHPFSFSAIINGYNKKELFKSGWHVILDYLEKQEPKHFGFKDIKVTHAWTQNFNLTKQLCKSCKIDNACKYLEEMKSKVDAVIIARDDWKTHMKFALPFLKDNIPVFIDKPLTIDKEELKIFKIYMDKNKLISSSGFRFAKELDHVRKDEFIKSIKLISSTVMNDVAKYGIHILEALSGIGIKFNKVKLIRNLEGRSESFLIILENDLPIYLNCIGKVNKTFHISIFGENKNKYVNLHNNFFAFRRTLEAFFEMVKYGKMVIDPNDTISLMNLLYNLKKIDKGSSISLINDF